MMHLAYMWYDQRRGEFHAPNIYESAAPVK